MLKHLGQGHYGANHFGLEHLSPADSVAPVAGLEHIRLANLGQGHFDQYHFGSKLSGSTPPSVDQIGDTFPIGWQSSNQYATFALGWQGIGGVTPRPRTVIGGGGPGMGAGWRRSVPTPSWREQEDEEVVMALIAAYLEIEHET